MSENMSICPNCNNLNTSFDSKCPQCNTDLRINLKDEILNGVIITDIQMPFLSMVWFIFKWVLASIPALITASLIMLLLGAFLGVFISDLSPFREFVKSLFPLS